MAELILRTEKEQEFVSNELGTVGIGYGVLAGSGRVVTGGPAVDQADRGNSR
jgi:hypothetical protein